MGSSSSKQNAAPSPSSPSTSPSPSFVRRTRSYRRGVFQSPCLPSRGNAVPHVSDVELKRSRASRPCAKETASDSSEVKRECCREVKVPPSEEFNSEILDAENEWDHSRGGCMSSRVFSSRGLNPSSRFLSRLSIFPGNISFRLNRANSFGSARPCFASSTRFPIRNTEEEPSTSGLTTANDNMHRCDFFPACFTAQSSVSPHAELSRASFLQNTSTQGASRDRVHAGLDSGENSFPVNHSSMEFIEERFANRRNGVGETVEQNVRFSRSLSVGRLRERVLRRSSFVDLAFGPSGQGREAGYASHVGEGHGVAPTSAVENAINSSASSSQGGSAVPSFIHGRQRSDVDTSRSREARYHDLLEYRSNFLERRRRIRSQVRALQRLGSRFENLSEHERSCIMSGQHRRGHCTCRINHRDIGSNDESSARASISRIVMLAEALFEVLDEIHQQSVVLSSRSSMSSLGSAPAPIDVVESLPLKLYNKMNKHMQDEVAQCYICLVEYEEGDSVRILPCHHEYHKTCIDKWLKEIHRVCPLCRGDVCRSDSLSANAL